MRMLVKDDRFYTLSHIPKYVKEIELVPDTINGFLIIFLNTYDIEEVYVYEDNQYIEIRKCLEAIQA